MKTLLKSLAVVLFAASVTACGGHGVEIPPAHVGKILTKNGYSPEVRPPSKFRLPFCMRYCDNLVLLEASDKPMKETFDLFMPKDKLKLSVEVRGTFTVPADEAYVGPIFDRVTATPSNYDSRTSQISALTVYNTYGQQAVRGVVRSMLVKYTIADILENRDTIGEAIHAAVVEKLAKTKTPIRISRFELAKVDPPSVIVDAQEAAKKREIDIQQANADAEVKLVEAQRALEVEQMNRLVEVEKAESIAEQNRVLAAGVTPELLEYRRLEAAEKIYTTLARSKNEGLIIIPADVSSFASIGGDAAQAKILGKTLNK